MSACVGPVKFWNPGISPAGMPVSRIASRSARSTSVSAARFGNTPGYSTGSSFASSGRATYLANSESRCGGSAFQQSLRPSAR